MRSQSQTIEYAQGLVRALKARDATIAETVHLFEEAHSPEARAAAGELLIQISEQAEIDFNSAMARAADRVAASAGVLAAAGRRLFGNRSEGV